jgi:hypothetical protein
MSRSLAAMVLLGLLLAVTGACAGGEADDDGGGDDVVDAAPRPDADEGDDDGDGDGPPDAGAPDATPDAAPEPAGSLGQACDQARPCPDSAPLCTLATADATVGMCTTICAQAFAFRTNAAGNPTTLPPASASTVCTDIFDGTAGTASCATFLTTSFAPPITGSRPSPNTDYTADVMCGIRCGTGSACPSGLRCSNQFCQP